MIGFLNSVVHVVLYSYYLIAALGPKYKKYLWWKKYVTKIQLVSGSSPQYLHSTARQSLTYHAILGWWLSAIPPRGGP